MVDRRAVLGGAAALALPSRVLAQKDGALRPALFLIGDSTIRNGGRDNGETGGQFGWGHMIKYYFDRSRIHVVNDAMGGTSSRSYLASPNLWAQVAPMIYPGDFVIVGFGHNDGRSTGPGNGDEVRPHPAPPAGGPVGEMVHSFGWYMRQYVRLIRARGAEVILVSPIPRNRWRDGKIARSDQDYALWARQAAEQVRAPYIPLNCLLADRFDALGQQRVTAELFPPREVVHPNWAGAALAAACVIEGLAMLETPLKRYLAAEPSVPATPDVFPPQVGELGPSAMAPKERRPRP